MASGDHSFLNEWLNCCKTVNIVELNYSLEVNVYLSIHYDLAN